MILNPGYLLKSFLFTWRIGRASENSKNTWIYVVEWHWVDGAVFCQIIFVGGIISMPGHHIEWRVILKIKLRITGRPLSEAFILTWTNPQYDKILFIDLPVQYMKTTSSEHGENMLCTKIVFCFCFDIQNNLCTQHVLPMFWACSLHVLNW